MKSTNEKQKRTQMRMLWGRQKATGAIRDNRSERKIRVVVYTVNLDDVMMFMKKMMDSKLEQPLNFNLSGIFWTGPFSNMDHGSVVGSWFTTNNKEWHSKESLTPCLESESLSKCFGLEDVLNQSKSVSVKHHWWHQDWDWSWLFWLPGLNLRRFQVALV